MSLTLSMILSMRNRPRNPAAKISHAQDRTIRTTTAQNGGPPNPEATKPNRRNQSSAITKRVGVLGFEVQGLRPDIWGLTLGVGVFNEVESGLGDPNIPSILISIWRREEAK